MEKENLAQSRQDDRRDIGRKNEIFKNGIKGINKITGKYNTSKPLTEVKIRCPCGFKSDWQLVNNSRESATARSTIPKWMEECTKGF